MAPDEVVVGATEEGETPIEDALAEVGGGVALTTLVEAAAPGIH